MRQPLANAPKQVALYFATTSRVEKSLQLMFVFLCLALSSTSQTLPVYVDTTGLVAWYPFTGNAVDSSGHGYDGTVTGATLTTDRFGTPSSAFQFNGSSSEITTSLVPVTGNGARTISCWFKYDSLPSPCGDLGLCIVGYGGDNRGCMEACKNFSLEISYTSYPPRVDVDGICIATSASTIHDTVDNSWHFFAAVYDTSYGDFRHIKLYLDGHFDSTTTEIWASSTAVHTDTLSTLQIGAGHYNCPRYFAGKIDDIGVWKRALDTCELYELYHATSSCITSQINTSKLSSFSIYPNPTADFLNISTQNKISNIIITNPEGQTILKVNSDKPQTQIDLSGLRPGVYFIKVNDTEIRRFIKQ